MTKTYEKYNFFQFFVCESLVFESDLLESWVNHSYHSFVMSNLLTPLFCPEQIAHGCSSVKSNVSNLLIVFLLSWATWANCSPSLFNLNDFEQKSEEQIDWKTDEWIPNPQPQSSIKQKKHKLINIWKKVFVWKKLKPWFRIHLKLTFRELKKKIKSVTN